jgi:hypothetical protein
MCAQPCVLGYSQPSLRVSIPNQDGFELASGRFLLLRFQVFQQRLDMLLPIQCSEAIFE